MAATIPIKKKEDLKKFIGFYKDECPNPRNHALILLGLHTALRIGDVLSLRWENIYDFQQNCFQTHLFLKEKKTEKSTIIALNTQARESLEYFFNTRPVKPKDFIFTKNTNYNKPLNRTQAYRIIRKAAKETLHMEHISCHSLRKTFGYHAWRQGISPAVLMDIYNHSSYQITKRYLGIEQDEKDDVLMSIDM